MSETSNPYQPPKASFDEETFFERSIGTSEQDGMRHPIPTDAFEGATMQGWETLKSGGGELIALAFGLAAVSFFSGRVDEFVTSLGDSPGLIILSFVLSVIVIVCDVTLRLQLFAKSLAKLRFDGGVMVRSTPTGHQILQAVILSTPLIISYGFLAGVDFVDIDSTTGSALLAVGLMMAVIGIFFEIITFSALLFIVDQNCSALEGLRRGLKFIWANIWGWLLFTLVIAPFVVVLGVFALCIGVVVSIAVLHCGLAVAYNRVAIPGRAYMQEGWESDAWNAPAPEMKSPGVTSSGATEPDAIASSENASDDASEPW